MSGGLSLLPVALGVACLVASVSCTLKQSASRHDYPYLPQGRDFYQDTRPYEMTAATPMHEIFWNSRFGGLMAVLDAREQGHVTEGESRVKVEGDGGFPGMTLERTGEFPWRLRATFPDLEESRVLILEREAGGWRVKEMKRVPMT